MATVIGVRFKSNGRVYYFDPGELTVEAGDGVIVETARGLEYGDCTKGNAEVEDDKIVQPLKPVVRVATAEDTAMRAQNCAKEDEAIRLCEQKIAQHKLDMKLVSAEYAFNGSKLVFYFTADERVDFRELVKDLAGCFKTRIELRQIGVRDEAKMLGGLGPCGRAVCCKAFLDDFRPVSIKMAKEQNLSLSPTKISGLCGRLMCCLQYEQNAYEDMKKKMPRAGREIMTPDGAGTALENNAVTERTRVRVTLADGTVEIRQYHYSELYKVGETPSEEMLEAARAAREARESGPKAAATRTTRTSHTSAAGAATSVGAYVPPEGIDETPEEESEKPAQKRRRRGGKGRGGRPQDGSGGVPAAKTADADPAQPAGESKTTGADAAGGQDPANRSRRRRRGGFNRKKEPQGPQNPS